MLQELIGNVETLCSVSRQMETELRDLFPGMPLYYTPSDTDLDQFTDPVLDHYSQILVDHLLISVVVTFLGN